MSSVSSIYSDSGSLSLVDLLSETEAETNSILNSSSTLASSNSMLSALRSKRAQNAYSGSAASSVGQAALKRALSEMPSDGGKVTFSDIARYREQLEAEFTTQVRIDLARKGVSLDTDFTLTLNAQGKIQVECDDPSAKAIIEQYLSDNAEACEQFGYIQALSNLERARQSFSGSQAAWQEVRNTKKSYQAEAVEAFFNDALSSGMNYASLLASFRGVSKDDEVTFYAGLDFTV